MVCVDDVIQEAPGREPEEGRGQIVTWRRTVGEGGEVKPKRVWNGRAPRIS